MTGYEVYRDGLLAGTPTAPSFLDGGLQRGTTYSYAVRARDAAGNFSALTAPVGATTPALAISAVSATAMATAATVTWTTDVPATSEVVYGTTAAYDATTGEAPSLVTSHAMTLTGLTPGTLYHFAVVSADASGARSASADFTFTTAAAGGGAFVNEILIQGMNLPTALKFLPNGDMLILELGGKVWVIPAGTTSVDPSPFLTLTNIGTLNGQQGLMDMALDPAFQANRFYYVFYTLGSPNRDRVSRFTATSDLRGTVAGSELVVYQDPRRRERRASRRRARVRWGREALHHDGRALRTGRRPGS